MITDKPIIEIDPEKTVGIILAAGLGTRMRPLTDTSPKSLLPVLGTPLFEVIVNKLLRTGVGEIHCNLFHLPERFEELAARREWPICFHHESELLGTGGGIGNMARDLARFETILLHNGDITSDIDYAHAVSAHRSRGALITMILTSSGPPQNVMITNQGDIISIADERQSAPKECRMLGYTGLSVLSPEALEFFPRAEASGLVEIIREIIECRPGSVIGYRADAAKGGCHWNETGTPPSYLDLHRSILIDKIRYDPLLEPPPLPLHVGKDASVDPGAQWRGFLEVGPDAKVERDTVLENCIVLEGSFVPAGSSYRRAIIYPGGVINITDDE